jgi:hypothetical protein
VTAIDPRTVAADIMCANARDITPAEVWAWIGQAYDTTNIDASIADEVTDLIAKAGIDLTWPDGSTNTELDAARVEIERLTAELAEARAAGEKLRALATAVERWYADDEYTLTGCYPAGEKLRAALLTYRGQEDLLDDEDDDLEEVA